MPQTIIYRLGVFTDDDTDLILEETTDMDIAKDLMTRADATWGPALFLDILVDGNRVDTVYWPAAVYDPSVQERIYDPDDEI